MTRIVFKSEELAELAKDLQNPADAIGRGAARAMNMVATNVRSQSVTSVVSQVNLKPAYVDPKIVVGKEAKPDNLIATIESAKRGVLLANFGMQQQAVANVWTPAMYAEKFGGLNALRRPNPKAGRLPWTPRTGDALRGIAPGAKQAGALAVIKAGGRASVWSHVFFIPAQRKGQDGSKWVTLARPKGGGKPTARYGPSVDQVVKGVWSDDADDILKQLGDEVLQEVTVEISKELKL